MSVLLEILRFLRPCMKITAAYSSLLPVAEFLSCLSWSYKLQSSCGLPLFFSWRWCSSSGFLSAADPGLCMCSSHLPKTSFTTSSGICLGSQPQSGGNVWVRYMGCWGCPSAHRGNLQVMLSQWLVGRLSEGVQITGSRDCIPLTFSETFIYLSPYSLPPPTHGASDLVLWMLQERNEPLWLCHVHWGCWAVPHLLFLSPGGNHRLRSSSLVPSCGALGEGQSQAFSLTYSNASKLTLFSSVEYGDFSSGNLHFQKGSVIAYVGLLRNSWPAAKRG